MHLPGQTQMKLTQEGFEFFINQIFKYKSKHVHMTDILRISCQHNIEIEIIAFFKKIGTKPLRSETYFAIIIYLNMG